MPHHQCFLFIHQQILKDFKASIMKSNWTKILPCVLLPSVANAIPTIVTNAGRHFELQSEAFRIRTYKSAFESPATGVTTDTAWEMDELLFYSDAACTAPIEIKNIWTNQATVAEEAAFDKVDGTVASIKPDNKSYFIGYRTEVATQIMCLTMKQGDNFMNKIVVQIRDSDNNTWQTAYTITGIDSKDSFTLNLSETWPTSEPSLSSSSEPTSEPSSESSFDPSSAPSSEATSEPSSEPSAEPSTDPSSEPSHEPSSEPSAEPTSDPSS